MRTKLALLAMAITSTYASAETEPAPADPYAEPAPRKPIDARPIDAKPTVRPSHGPLGFVALDLSPELRMHLGAPRDRGVLVDAVFPNTFAAKAGLKVGDLVLDLDNAPVTAAGDLIAGAGKRKQGDQLVLDVMRTGIPTTLRATLEQDPATSPRVEPRGDLERQLQRQLEEMRRRLDAMERRFESDKSPR